MNGVQVFAGVGEGGDEIRELEVDKMSEVFGKVAATVHGRLEVRFIVNYSCSLYRCRATVFFRCRPFFVRQLSYQPCMYSLFPNPSIF